MKFILEKTILSEKYPYLFFQNREKLIGLLPEHDDLVVAFLKATNAIIAKTKAESTLNFLPFDWPQSNPNDTVTYAVLPFDTQMAWNNLRNSIEFVNYHEITKKLFPLLGWVDCGYKAIDNVDYADLQKPDVMEKLAALWDAN